MFVYVIMYMYIKIYIYTESNKNDHTYGKSSVLIRWKQTYLNILNLEISDASSYKTYKNYTII